jgi:hypothetical protein
VSLTGYRWWIARLRRRAGWQLRSLARSVWWRGPHLVAPSPPRARRDEVIPLYRCDGGGTCHGGIHAFKSETLALDFAHTFLLSRDRKAHTYPVWGAVALWGKVVEHERGYRAEHAMIRRLVVPERLVIPGSQPPYFCGCFLMSGDFFEREAAEEMPASDMIAALSRCYGVDVEFGEVLEIAG